ncbi:MAG: DNA methyltransferase [Ktedonobacteraceae bacterium]
MVYSKPHQIGTIFQKEGILISPSISMEDITNIISNTPYDVSITQERLNLTNKFRTSLFPWRGQFSPEFVEILLDQYSQSSDTILDPFVGSGTTLFEAARKGLKCYGVEINPSAIAMAKTAQFANIALLDRKAVIKDAEAFVDKYLAHFNVDLFSYQNEDYNHVQHFDYSEDEVLRKLVQEASKDPLIQNFITNVFIRYMNYHTPRTPRDFFRALREHTKIVMNIPYSKEECQIFHCDARSIPLADGSIDLIITSPPYINVFNYHQNNRPAMELIGWDLLNIAKSEIGSNRKNRQNRFLTVIQYALDMLDTLIEMRRLLNPNGRAIVVVGRESSVRGTSLKNGILVASLALGGAGLRLEAFQERSFTNKFGESIYEDILHFVPSSEAVKGGDIARSIAIWSLDQTIRSDEQVNFEILDAKKRANTVQKSPIFDISASLYRNIGLVSEK